MSINYFVKKLIEIRKKAYSLPYRIILSFFGLVLFGILFPWFLIVISNAFIYKTLANIQNTAYLIKDIFLLTVDTLEVIFVIITIPVGLFLIGWSILLQFRIGKGSPAHIAPTQKLVTSGPYGMCRNPMQLGGMLYYLGLGTWFSSFGVGLMASFIMYILGRMYHKTIEEKELEKHFGAEYKKYKKEVPFLFPNLWKYFSNKKGKK
ncbi:isoprenylcysteine carboxylmethyltransferase family protein [bacterium]|jgi:protein-S-isoprenylcysteine O-methyltransferase Ste14|nr:isoprenylcysteine carboxylmethyltransferase family protein [bacterium]